MYSKQEASAVKEKFWTSFGRYMQPVPAANGDRINWVNYKTGVKDIRFKMDAGATFAIIMIELTHKDPEKRGESLNRFIQLKTEMEEIIGEKWVWEPAVSNEKNGPTVIYMRLEGVNILREADWPAIISFLKPRICSLDVFWQEYKEIFEMNS
jgi:hypothetical protein